MKTTAFISVIAIIQLIISCGQSGGVKRSVGNHKDTSKIYVNKGEQERMEKRKKREEQDRVDSINDAGILQQALQIAERHSAKDKFHRKYITTPSDSSYQVQVAINCGFYFTNAYPHLIIRRSTPASVYIDIFSKQGKQFHNVLSHEQWAMEYTGDTIRDIDGDGLKDFVVNWYGSTGCCLKAFSNVYLQRRGDTSFSNSFEFINPTFSPKEHIIRGVCYGHPGETEMYKYRWNKEDVDTVEYIYYEKNDKGIKTGKLIVSNNLPYSDNHTILRRLNIVPAEYRKIDGYDWFADNLDQKENR